MQHAYCPHVTVVIPGLSVCFLHQDFAYPLATEAGIDTYVVKVTDTTWNAAFLNHSA